MATLGNYFLNGPSLGSSTTIFLDANLTLIAPNGFYSDGVTSREQVSGVLLPAVTCGSCATPCGDTISASGGQGIYLLNLDAGSTVSDVGAVVIRFNPFNIPDGIKAIFDGNVYNKISSPVDGYHQSTDPNGFTVLGQLSNDCGLTGNISNFPALQEFIFNGTSFVATGNTQNITITPGDVSLGSLSPDVCVMVIPKTAATPSLVNIEVVGPCGGTAFNVSVDCPVLLPSFSSSIKYNSSNISCEEPLGKTFHFVKVHTATDTFVGLYDYVFEDSFGALALADGFYLIDNVASPNKVIEVVNGIVVAFTDCSASPSFVYNSVVLVEDCNDQTGTATTILDINEADVIIGGQLTSTSGGNLTPLNPGVYRMSLDLIDGQVYNLVSIPVSTYIVQVDNSGFIINKTQC